MGEKMIYVSDEMWKCPRCGSGVQGGEGLIEDDDRMEEFEGDLYPSDLQMRCYARDKDGYDCGWEGTIAQVAAAWAKKHDRVKCPCCGMGFVPAKKAEKYKKVK